VPAERAAVLTWTGRPDVTVRPALFLHDSPEKRAEILALGQGGGYKPRHLTRKHG
jgi:hypothetical protein